MTPDHSALIERLEAVEEVSDLHGGAAYRLGDLIDEAATAIRELTEWRDFKSAPRDGSYIWAVFKDDLPGDMMNRWSGVQASIRHEGKTISDYDLGWSIARAGFGGVSEHHFAGWLPLPSAPNQAKEAGE